MTTTPNLCQSASGQIPPGGRRTARRNSAIDLLIIMALWCASLVFVNPRGDFPLNDGWVYGRTVEVLMATGHYLPPGEEVTLITNVLWGLLFCLPAGFSFNALRLSTLVLSLLGVSGAYFLTRELRAPRWSAVLAALVVGFNPIYYALSNTFMTDVPFTAMAIIAALFLVRNLRSGSDRDLIVGTAFVVAATLSRQCGIAVPVAFALALVLRRGFTRRSIPRAVAPTIVALAALFAFKQWLGARAPLEAYRADELLHVLTTPGKFLHSIVLSAYKDLFYLGWFLMPVLILATTRIVPLHRKKASAIIIASLGVLIALLARYVYTGRNVLMPLSGNVIVGAGIGPLTLRDAFELHLGQPPALPVGFWLVITVVGLVGAALLCGVLGVWVADAAPKLRPGKMGEIEAARTFLLLGVGIYLLPCLVTLFFDRYLVFTVPLLAASIASISTAPPGFSRVAKAVSRVAALVFLVASGLFAVLGTKDYLAWNRARWQALDDLIGSGTARAEEIDGGYEFNGFYLYDPSYRECPSKAWWWVREDKYQIAFGDVPGYRTVKEYSYNRWMPPQVGKVVVLQRDAQAVGVEGSEAVGPNAPAGTHDTHRRAQVSGSRRTLSRE